MREIGSAEVAKLRECLEALACHHNDVSVHFKGCYPIVPIEQTLERFGCEVEEGAALIAVVEDGEGVGGFCKINVDGIVGTLEYLIVLERERGKGHGAALMDWALGRFRELGVKDVNVKVVYGNEAIGLYRKYGFKEKSVVLGLSL